LGHGAEAVEAVRIDEVAMARHNPTPKKKGASPRAFLAAYAETCSVTRAAKAAKIDRSTHYAWLTSDEEYRNAFAEAREQAADTLEDEAVRRAHEGVQRPVTVAGQKVLVREYSDTLLIFLLKAIRPEKYRERSEVTVPGLTDLVERLAAGRKRAAGVKRDEPTKN
jgi:hypothetical protein